MEIISKNIIGREFIPLLNAKEYLRVNGDHDDALIETKVNSCVDYAENYCGINIRQKEIEAIIHVSSSEIKIEDQLIELLSIQEVTSKKVLEKEKDYKVERNKIILNNKYIGKKLNVSYISGFKDVPIILVQAILRHLLLMYDKDTVSRDNLESIHILYNAYRKIKI